MRKTSAILTVTLTLFLCLEAFSSFSSAEGLVWENISREEKNIKTLLVNPDDSRLIYFGSDNGVFKSEDRGASWRRVLSFGAKDKTINRILFDPLDKDRLYAAGADGLCSSPDSGISWTRIFKAGADSECSALAILPYGIYLGTPNGLFVSKDQGLSWQKEKDELGRSSILAIANNPGEPDYLYAATDQKIFLSQDQGASWVEIFKADTTSEEANEENETEEPSEEPEKSFQIRYIAIGSNTSYLYAATSRGIYRSQDKGQSWQALSASGLPSRDIAFILISAEDAIYAAVRGGIFEYQNEYWQELSIGLNAGKIHYLAKDNNGSLYAATDKGLFKTAARDKLTPSDFKADPDIRQVQKAAIEYAEVNPEKINRWRKQAAKQALLPKLTVGLDRDNNRTTSANIWGTSGSNGSSGRHYLGPDTDTEYDNNNWSVSLSWELGDFIWNDDQTSIDVRSRLMVQLRNDILDEVTRTYFERLRLKKELLRLKPDDPAKREEKKLRIEELTANLDALTGGYFSNFISHTQ